MRRAPCRGRCWHQRRRRTGYLDPGTRRRMPSRACTRGEAKSPSSLLRGVVRLASRIIGGEEAGEPAGTRGAP
jgi:hypothetical protein